MDAEVIFRLSSQQMERYRAWRDQHDEVCRFKGVRTAIGGRYTFEFTNTTIGQIAGARCACKEAINLTDWEDL